MQTIRLSKSPINPIEITAMLQALRHHAIVELSHFAVAAVVEILLPNGGYAYVGGVNVENKQHHRLSNHAEQTAITTAQTLFGGNVKLSNAWVMGGPEGVHQGENSNQANNPIKPCGHCRQILLSLSQPNATIFSVTINGVISPADKLTDLLPQAFSERDLGEVSTHTLPVNSDFNSLTLYNQRQYEPVSLMETSFKNEDHVLPFLRAIKPHIIDPKLKTSPVDTCILKVLAEGHEYYIPGSLVQDAAFLSTDAIFTAVGIAATKFGKQFEIAEIYLYSQSLETMPLFPAEMAHLARFINNQPIFVKVFNSLGECPSYIFEPLTTDKENYLLKRMPENNESTSISLSSR